MGKLINKQIFKVYESVPKITLSSSQTDQWFIPSPKRKFLVMGFWFSFIFFFCWLKSVSDINILLHWIMFYHPCLDQGEEQGSVVERANFLGVKRADFQHRFSNYRWWRLSFYIFSVHYRLILLRSPKRDSWMLWQFQTDINILNSYS